MNFNEIREYLPNIIYIGPDKSGSSWLYFIFKQHPEIFVSSIKDIYFFDKNYDKGVKWYISFFKKKNKEKFICDISHDYLFSKEAAKRIKNVYNKYDKNVILISNLRNPIEKLWSHYLFLLRSGITKEPIETAINSYPELINESLYYENVKFYKELFKENYKVFLFDDLKKNSQKFAYDLFNSLNITIYDDIAYSNKVLPASKPRNFYLAKYAKILASYLRKNNYLNLLGYLKNNSFINKLLFTPYVSKPELSDEIAHKLWNLYFKKDIENLSKLLNIDFINLWGTKYE